MEKSIAPSFSSHRSPCSHQGRLTSFPMPLASYSTLAKQQKGRKEVKIPKHSSQASN
jgi:hypothetical protein